MYEYIKFFGFRQIILVRFNLKSVIFILNYMDIREFYRSNQKSTDQNNNNFNNSFNQNTNGKDYQNNSAQDFSQYQDTINKYKDLSQEDLYSELLSQATDLKAQGKLDTSMLEQISTTLTPMLNDEQKQLLNNIMNKIK